MMKMICMIALIYTLSACCTIGPNDKPDGVSGYLTDCYNHITKKN